MIKVIFTNRQKPKTLKEELREEYGVIKHIPHASLKFPKEYCEDRNLKLMFGLDYKIQNCKLCDLLVDDLFSDIEGVEVKAEYTRLYCDVERYKDDDKEPMSKYGQGYIYTKNIFNGEKYLRKFTFNGNNLYEGIEAYYDAHHKRLTDETRKILKSGKKVLLLDLHSYSDELATIIGKEGPFPDVCIGLNEHYDEKVLNLIIKEIEERGLSYQINHPYSGLIIPNGLTKEEVDNICSIMIEVNKKIYL